MAIIGSWGNVVFEVSHKEIKTFTGLKWDVGAKFATHERHLKEPLLEFTGTELESISFSISFSAFLGSDPMYEIQKLNSAVKRGEANRLIIGSRAYGSCRWVATKASHSLDTFDNRGNLLTAKVSITMQSYFTR